MQVEMDVQPSFAAAAINGGEIAVNGRNSGTKPDLTFALPVDSQNKATEFRLFSFAKPHMRSFHVAWVSFFACFVSTFAFPPLLPVIRDDLSLTAADINNAAIAAVSAAVLSRLCMGALCDLVGPRRSTFVLCLLTAPAVFCSSLVESAAGYVAVRFFVGLSLANFVSSQYWMSSMFGARVVGGANGLAGGWGNLGGGFSQLIMPLIYDVITYKIGVRPFRAWRLAFFVLALFQYLCGMAVLLFGQDLPDGNFRLLKKEGKKVEDSLFKVIYHAVTNYRAWVLALSYGYCFGVELTIDNIIANYFYDRFGLKLAIAGIVGSSFGLANLFSRPMGGVISDWVSHGFGMRGRLWALWIVQTIGGLLCLLLGKMDTLTGAIIVMIFFSVFVEAACGLTFGVVPFISRRSLGIVSGMTGAGGNIGAAVTQAIFFGNSNSPTEGGITLMGIMIIACTLPQHLIYFKQWGGMLCGPDPTYGEKEYYVSEWNRAEREKGYDDDSVKFAENSMHERGRGIRGASQIEGSTTV